MRLLLKFTLSERRTAGKNPLNKQMPKLMITGVTKCEIFPTPTKDAEFESGSSKERNLN